MITGAAIDKTLRTIDLQMEIRTEMSEGDLKELSREICTIYGFSDARIKAVCCAPEPTREADHYAPQGAAEKKRDGAVKDVIYGEKKLSGKTVPVGSLDLKTGKATVMAETSQITLF